ncbi:aminotransferase class IV [Pontibacter sp. CAU 1760]
MAKRFHLLLYNNQLLPEDVFRLPDSNRAFQYGDGFFETILVQEGKLRFWEHHLQRMQEAATALQVELPNYFFQPSFPYGLLALAHKQRASEYGRLKLKVWRAGKGLYTPERNTVDWLATVQPMTSAPTVALQVGIGQTVQTYLSPFSHFKGPQAAIYILAGLEKKARQLDDLILLDKNGNASELISANLFWLKSDKIYTPALATGCVHGVMRRAIAAWCQHSRVPFVEELAGVEQVLTADLVFAGNVTGLKAIAQLEEITLLSAHPLLDKLRLALLAGNAEKN